MAAPLSAWIAWTVLGVLALCLGTLILRRRASDRALLQGPDTIAALDGVDVVRSEAAAGRRVDQLLTWAPADVEGLRSKPPAYCQGACPLELLIPPVLEADQLRDRVLTTRIGGERVNL